MPEVPRVSRTINITPAQIKVEDRGYNGWEVGVVEIKSGLPSQVSRIEMYEVKVGLLARLGPARGLRSSRGQVCWLKLAAASIWACRVLLGYCRIDKR